MTGNINHTKKLHRERMIVMMDLRTAIKLHLENLNKRVLELHENGYIEDLEELKRIQIEADVFAEAFRDVDKELNVAAVSVWCNAAEIKNYINNTLHEKGIVAICKPGIDELDNLVALATYVKVEDLSDTVQSFRLF